MTEERMQRILDVALELEAQGMVATNSAVYARVLGHRGHVSVVMKARRAQQNGGAVAVAVADVAEDEAAPDEEAPVGVAATLQEDLTQLAYAYDSWHLALERLWAIEQEGPLTETQFGRKSWLEYQMIQNLETQERLRPQLQAARKVDAALAAQAHHDGLVPDGLRLAHEALEAARAAGQLWKKLAALFDQQITPLMPLQDAHGNLAFTGLGGEAEALFVALYGGDSRAQAAFGLLTAPPSIAMAALTACARLKPLAPRAVSNYVHGLTTGGATNGYHAPD
jgi:hypothetical protein